MSAIKAGDLVCVVRPTVCCGNHNAIGLMFKVASVQVTETRCQLCGKSGIKPVAFSDDDSGEHMSTVIKIDPPPLTEDTPATEELTA